MRISYTILLLFFLGSFTGLKGQDIHFSQFNLSPLTLNPANTGAYEGTFRVGGIYRDQWQSFLESQFVTPSIYIDAPIVRGFRKNDWVGAGLYIVNDTRGSGGLTTNSFMLSGAYHAALDKKANTYLSLGLQTGSVQERVNGTDLRFEDQFVDAVFNSSVQSVDLDKIQEKASYTDFNAGLMLNSVVSSKINFNLGVSAYHLLTPDKSLLGSSSESIPLRLGVHGGANVDLTDKVVLSPSFMYLQQATTNQTHLQAMVGYHLTATKDVTPKIGLGYRFGRDLVAMLGMEYKGFNFGMAYDVNVSNLDLATANKGGFEIALSYTARIFKPPVVKQVIFCPRF